MGFFTEGFKEGEEGEEGESAEEKTEVESRENVGDKNQITEIAKQADGNNCDDFWKDAPFFRGYFFVHGFVLQFCAILEVTQGDVLGQLRVFGFDINRFRFGGSEVFERVFSRGIFSIVFRGFGGIKGFNDNIVGDFFGFRCFGLFWGVGSFFDDIFDSGVIL